MDQAANRQLMTRIAIIVGVVVVIAAVVWAVVYGATRPSEGDFKTARNELIEKVSSTQAKLAPAFNVYLKSYSQAESKTSSIEKAKAAASTEQKAFATAETAARDAVNDLKASRATSDGTVGSAVDQFATSADEMTNYYQTLLGSYDEFDAIFASEEKLCSDVLVGKTTSLADRRDKLAAAVKDCYPAIDRLKKSGNVTYAEYATTIENRIKTLQENAVAVAKGEADYKQFKAEQDKLEAQLKKSSGTSAEYAKLKDQIKALTAKIQDSQSAFNDAASSYKSTVEELPKLYENVFKEAVPKQTKLMSTLMDVRQKTLAAVLDDKLLQ